MNKYPKRIKVSTPTGSMSIEWKAVCVQLGVTRAKALLRSWETTQKAGVGVFVYSNTYGCMDYWSLDDVTYYKSPMKAKPSVETTWSTLKKVMLYKLF